MGLRADRGRSGRRGRHRGAGRHRGRADRRDDRRPRTIPRRLPHDHRGRADGRDDLPAEHQPVRGKEGKYVTSRHSRTAWSKELDEQRRAARRARPTRPTVQGVAGAASCTYPSCIETMRREGYELQVCKPQVITASVDGEQQRAGRASGAWTCRRTMPAPSSRHWASRKRPMLLNMVTARAPRRLEITIPSARACSASAAQFLTLTRGTGHHEPHLPRLSPPGPARSRPLRTARSSARRPVAADAYATGQPAGARQFLHHAATEVYEGMIVGRERRKTTST